MIRAYEVTDASVHDSQVFEELLGPAKDNSDVYADSAYRSKQAEENLAAAHDTSHVHERAYRNTPLTESQTAANRERSKIRVRVEHVFGSQLQLAGDLVVRTIGLAQGVMRKGGANRFQQPENGFPKPNPGLIGLGNNQIAKKMEAARPKKQIFKSRIFNHKKMMGVRWGFRC